MIVVPSLPDAAPLPASPPADRSFVARVAAVRGHLALIHSREALAASYEREACRLHRPPGTPETIEASAVRVAYAQRWLELGPDPVGDAREAAE